MPSQTASPADWLQPPAEQQGLKRYLETLRERFRIVVLATLLGGVLATAYVLTAEKKYEAEADVLIAPIPADEAILASVGLFVESNDPALDVETAARVIDSAQIARLAATRLDNGLTADEILDQTTVEPVPESNVVAVTAQSDDAEEAASVANAYAQSAVEERGAELRDRIDQVLPRLNAQLRAAEAGGTAAETLAAQVAELEVLRAGDNPTLRLETPATAPDSPVSPRPALTIAGGVVGGAALGLMIAFALQVLDPVLRREEQLRSLMRLPILGRIPREAIAMTRPLGPGQLTPIAREAYRTLRGTIAAAERGPLDHRSMVITGPGPAEGKTTTAINLAASLALLGRRVILIESDLRRPAISAALGVKADVGVVSVLTGQTPLEEAFTTSRQYGANLQMLLADASGPGVAELLSLPAAQRLLTEAREVADYVIVDAPPLIDVVDALPLARDADAVLLVVRLGRSRLSRIKELGELLASNGVRPIGFALLGVSRTGRDYYYYSGDGKTELPSTLNRSATEGAGAEV